MTQSAVLAPPVRRLPPHRVLVAAALLFALPQNLVISGVGGSLTPGRLLGALCLLWWLVARFGGGLGLRVRANPVRAVLFGALLVLACANALALFLGVPDDRLGSADRNTLLYVVCAGIALLACDGLDRAATLRAVFGAVVLGAAASAFAASVAFAVKVDLRSYLGFPGLTVQGIGESDLARGGLERALGFANHPIELAAVCAAAVPLALHLVRHARFPPLWWACVAVLGAGVTVSISRTGLLGLGLIVLFALPRLGLRRWLPGVLGLAAAVGLAAAAVPRLAEVLANTILGARTDNSLTGRLDDYTYVADALAARPLSGQGFGTYTAPPQPYLDNQYLLTAVESGLPGALALIALLLLPSWAAWRVFRKAGSISPELRDAAWAVAVGLLVCMACFATFDAMAFPQFQALTFLMIGLAGAVTAQARAGGNE
ncbi:O-antigen ligase [Crossiella equi]|uniref:O-antigen ligase n=1 Tax=Crossiella equi TaxID=130796 RepID=A0ABS5ABH7_9PSEU|nr:O-antigen ligase family protein [Crossiella equi]MBP2473936.1 O-antigen ligase [Crossiella equi]